MTNSDAIATTSPRTHLMAVAAAGVLLSAGARADDCSVNVKPGPTIPAQSLAQEAGKSNPCLLVPGLRAKTLNSVWGTLLASAKTGGKRFENVPPTGMPSGKLRVTAPGLAFNLQAVAAEGVLSLQVSTGGQPVWAAAQPVAAMLVLPSAKLKPGNSYDWLLITRKGSYRASFEMIEADEGAEVQARIDAVADASLSPQLRLLYQAAIYDDAELYGARDQALAELRLLLAR